MRLMRDCGRKKPHTCENDAFIEWSASHPLLVQLPNLFDTQIWTGFDWVAGQRPRNALISLFTHYKLVGQYLKGML